jgi:hypothetical protein
VIARYKQRALIDFLDAVKETMGKIHKRLSNIYGNPADDKSWVKGVRDGEVGTLYLLDVLHQPET